MKYVKPMAEHLIFDNSDVLTNNSNNCGHGTQGNSCSNKSDSYTGCPNMNHGSVVQTRDFTF